MRSTERGGSTRHAHARPPPAGSRAPRSRGACARCPGWGLQLPPERVLAEMAGARPRRDRARPARLARRRSRRAARAARRLRPRARRRVRPARAARGRARRRSRGRGGRGARLAAAGADVFVAALVLDAAWSRAARRSTPRGWPRSSRTSPSSRSSCAAHGLDARAAPARRHAGRDRGRRRAAARRDRRRLVPRHRPPADRRHRPRRVRRATTATASPTCTSRTSTRRVAARYRAGELDLIGRDAARASSGRSGRGDARIAEVLAALDAHGYERWLVLEQDVALTGAEPPVGSGPVLDVQASIEFLASWLRRERVA